MKILWITVCALAIAVGVISLAHDEMGGWWGIGGGVLGFAAGILLPSSPPRKKK